MADPLQSKFAADSAVPKTSPGPHRTASMHTTQHPSPIGLNADSFWQCQCGAANEFGETNRVRPLGRCNCTSCGAVMNSLSQARNIDVTPVEGIMFMISLPPGNNGPPQSLFGCICCNCGRSHLRERMAESAHSKASQAATPKESLRKKIWKTYKKIKDREAAEDATNEDDDWFPERKSFTIKFNKPCTCGHTTCMQCPKFKIVADGEWVAQVREVGT